MYRFTIFLLFIGSFTTQGQEYQMDASLSTVNDCNGFFTDSGGSSGNYQNNENLSTIICKDPLEGTHIKLTFADIDLAPGDKLCFYDGLSTASDSIICIEYFFNGFPIIVQATAANPTGCLLVTFKSNDNGEVRSGWQAGIDCIPSCQAIQATIESTNPQAIPLERGFIDICEGERVFLNGNANYPQNNLVYEHNNTTSTFEWDFGDGTFAVGNNVSHVYRQAGGYQVSLKVTDQFGCTNGNFAFQRVRVATKPEFKIGAIPTEVCIGDSILLSGGIGENSNASTIAVCNQEGSFLFNGARSDSLALPDGNGASYKTSIRFTDFAAGQVLTDINDLQSLCLNMEHSWLHDMEISITCPSGNTVLLQSQEVINKEVYLGIPIDNDGITPQSGRGLDYCWSPTSKNGTLTEFANNDDDSSPNETYHLPAGDFNSFEDLEALLGCPLNGDWIITVTDLWEQDNGWIFSWSIDINPDLYPDLATFEPQITNYQWQNSPDFTSVTSELVVAQPTSAGDVNYIFEATDDFGCSHDTSIQITVLPNNHPDCLNCEDHLLQQKQVVICPETSLNLEAFIDPYALGVIDFRSFPEYEFSKTTHPPQNPYEAPIQVSNVPGGEIKPDGSNLIAVCLNLTSEFNSDLSITLISPNGVHLNLSSENGGRNDGYLNTCFTLSANRSITQTTDAPFTGNYQPEEPFSNLAGTDINGLWKLQLSDDAGSSVTDVNVLKNWSLTFLSPSGATFNWTPTETLSCSDCTNPTASPTVSTNYVLEKNFEGCQVFDTLKVTILGEDRPTNIKEVSLRAGNLLVNWDTLPNVNAFEVSINSVDWLPANNGLTSHIFSELTQSETFNVYVRGVYDGFPCASKFLSRAVRYRFCDLVADLGSQNLVTSCSGANDAFAVIVANGGSGGYTFTLNDSLTQFNNRFDNLTSGAYQVLITDNQSCADTLNFTVTAPPPLSLSFDKVDLGCFGDNNGSVTVFPSGGVGDYEVIQWSNTGSKNTALSNLSAGTYWVEMADANNCPIIDTFEMIEPTQLKALATATPITCFGAADGGVSVKVTDGTPPYNFDWN
ncbi:MAG: proprotein convertase P-domain-containing protein, partial [Saprospiraceae bacterium]